MLKSSDLEMVRLGAVLLRRYARNKWWEILTECQGDKWYFIIENNNISIIEKEDIFTWTIPTTSTITTVTGITSTSFTNTTGTTNIVLGSNSYPLQSYGMTYVDYKAPHSRDIDRERKKEKDKRAEKLRRESIKYKNRI